MADLTPRQRRLVAAPFLGIVLLAAGGFAWAAGWPLPGIIACVLAVAVIPWGLVGQQRDPVLRARRQPTMQGGGGSEGGR